MTRDTDECVVKCDSVALCDNGEGFRGALVHYAVRRKGDDSIFRSLRFTE